VRLFSIKSGEANLVEITLPDNSKCVGKSVSEVTLPKDVSLAAIIRDRHVITPGAHEVFAAGDELIFVASSESESLIKGCFVSASN
jgi:trk system potassium uptake protein TrkA